MKSKKQQADIIIPGASKGLETIIEFKAMDVDGFIKTQPNAHKVHLIKIKDVIEKHKAAIDEIANAILEYKRILLLENPVIYVARTTDIKTGKEYFTAKTTWIVEGFKTKEVKIYLGKASDFGNDTQSEKAKEFALIKMRQTLARRIRAGEI